MKMVKLVDKELSFAQVAVYGIIIEAVLLGIQLVYIQFYTAYINPGSEPFFTTIYMEQVGFYLFQIVGFLLFAVATIILLRWIHRQIFYKMLVMFIVSSVLELIFYLLIQANFEIAFVYSILDKFLAIALGVIAYEIIVGDKKISSGQ